MKKKVAVITGTHGQDGSYLSKFLLDEGYIVVGFNRRSGSCDGWRHKELGIETHPNLINEFVDLTEYHNVVKAIEKWQPEMIFNLAAMSFVATSFEQPFLVNKINYEGVLNLIDGIKLYSPETKLYQASTSEMFGRVLETPQNENTPFNPISPYGISKLSAHHAIRIARESGIFACAGILFNHEGSLRGEEFVTRKISKAIAEMRKAYEDDEKPKVLEVGNLYALRDWGNSEDYVKGMYLMLQQETPDDFVLATGQTNSVKEFINTAWRVISEEPLAWYGEGIEEYAVDFNDNIVVKINEDFYRPLDVMTLLGDPTKANQILGWASSTTFSELVSLMVKKDMERLEE